MRNVWRTVKRICFFISELKGLIYVFWGWQNRGQEGYGRRERKGREVGIPKGREAGEIGGITQHCIIFRNRKRAKGRKPRKKGRRPGLQGMRGGRFGPPCPSLPPHERSCEPGCLMKTA